MEIERGLAIHRDRKSHCRSGGEFRVIVVLVTRKRGARAGVIPPCIPLLAGVSKAVRLRTVSYGEVLVFRLPEKFEHITCHG